MKVTTQLQQLLVTNADSSDSTHYFLEDQKRFPRTTAVLINRSQEPVKIQKCEILRLEGHDPLPHNSDRSGVAYNHTSACLTRVMLVTVLRVYSRPTTN